MLRFWNYKHVSLHGRGKVDRWKKFMDLEIEGFCWMTGVGLVSSHTLNSLTFLSRRDKTGRFQT